MKKVDCPLCIEDGGICLVRTKQYRIVAPCEPEFLGLIRVIWNEHVVEMTDLEILPRNDFMRAVYFVEESVRQMMNPDKINLASLGNAVPHLHWHIIPRWLDDSYFPVPIWGQRQREISAEKVSQRQSDEQLLMRYIQEQKLEG
ncbi:MAG: HIT family protein [Polynucleobacter sp.]|jgi:diadenosine tetraphosphate (Ap4A) HIT family hydrolase|nr:HIT family protein [Polynucleobacter sp.]